MNKFGCSAGLLQDILEEANFLIRSPSFKHLQLHLHTKSTLKQIVNQKEDKKIVVQMNRLPPLLNFGEWACMKSK